MALRKPGFVLFLMVYSPKDHLGCPIIVCYEVTSTDIKMHGLIIFTCCYSCCCYHNYYYGWFLDCLVNLWFLICQVWDCSKFVPPFTESLFSIRIIWKLHLLLLYHNEMASHGKISLFEPNKKQWSSYAERLDFHFEAKLCHLWGN